MSVSKAQRFFKFSHEFIRFTVDDSGNNSELIWPAKLPQCLIWIHLKSHFLSSGSAQTFKHEEYYFTPAGTWPCLCQWPATTAELWDPIHTAKEENHEKGWNVRTYFCGWSVHLLWEETQDMIQRHREGKCSVWFWELTHRALPHQTNELVWTRLPCHPEEDFSQRLPAILARNKAQLVSRQVYPARTVFKLHNTAQRLAIS